MIMFCCDVKSTVNNLASRLEQVAMEEVKEKKILGNAYILAACSSPYGVDNVVVIKEQNKTEIYYCGRLVFLWNWGLQRYICGDWTNVLSNEIKAMKAQKREVRAKDRRQTLANNWAMKNYVMC